MAQTWNEALLEQVGSAIGKEMDEFGVTFWLAPALNIHRNPLCGRNYEYYSEDPVVSGKMAAAVTRGVQKWDGCFVALKHFCANNQEDNRNRVSSNISERALREIYLKAFEIAVKEGNENSEAIQALVNALKSDEITQYINDTYDGAVIPFN